MDFGFRILKESAKGLMRAGTITTPHGDINTPGFTVVGTKATVKALTPQQLKEIGIDALLANTYHLYLEPGEELIEEHGGLHTFMNYDGPMITDSGGFQVFSLGEAFEKKQSKIAFEIPEDEGLALFDKNFSLSQARLARIDEEGVTFTSHLDGSTHRFTAERSIEIQHALGADIIFAFDECTSPTAPHQYQKEAMERTHRWAKRSLDAHFQNLQAKEKQALYGVVQGGRFADLREESARYLRDLSFDGYGIGGSFTKQDLKSALALVNSILPKEKPRHLLGIGEPKDLFLGISLGVDTFDCVQPTRIARNGSLYTKTGKITILNSKFRNDKEPIEPDCECYACSHFSKAYIAHLFRCRELLDATLASIHNLYFITHLVQDIRQSILEERFDEFRKNFEKNYVE